MLQPGVECHAHRRVQWHGAAGIALAGAYAELPFASGEGDVGGVQGGAFRQAHPGIEEHEGQRPIPRARAAVHRADEPLLLHGVKGAGRGRRQRLAAHLGPVQPQEAVEVIESRQGQIDGARRGVPVARELALVVAHGVVAGLGLLQRIAVPQVGVREPGEEGGDLGGVGRPTAGGQGLADEPLPVRAERGRGGQSQRRHRGLLLVEAPRPGCARCYGVLAVAGAGRCYH